MGKVGGDGGVWGMKLGGVVGVVGPLVGPWGPLVDPWGPPLANHGVAKGAKNGQERASEQEKPFVS